MAKAALEVFRGLTLGVCVLPGPEPNAPRGLQYGAYVHEILGHAGLACRSCEPRSLAADLDGGLRILVTVGDAEFDVDLTRKLAAWVSCGGVWISICGLCGLEHVAGANYVAPDYALWGGSLRSLGEGYLAPPIDVHAHPILQGIRRPLHFFGGIALKAVAGVPVGTVMDAHGRPTPYPALVELPVAAGRFLVIAIDIPGTVVRIQQGLAVTRDGISSPDGTAPVADGVLKSDDGQVLDWLIDRNAVPGVDGLSAFLEPAADGWRDFLLRTIFYAATKHGVFLPLLWYWPHAATAVGHLSHDTDGNDPRLARELLSALRAAGVRSTWCVILPGYERELIAEIAADGHELAMHFNALGDENPWCGAAFGEQRRALAALFGKQAPPVTNKNHYLRWEGDTELWEWCILNGIRLDQSKGASKTGEAGFNFGTCHAYRPVDSHGAVLDVLELATTTQDLNVFAPEELRAPLLAAALRHYGVLHLLYHPIHIDKKGVSQSIARSVAAGRDHGLEWWTAREIAEWERARRTVRWTEQGDLVAGAPLKAATVLFVAPHDMQLRLDGMAVGTEPVERWGFAFQSICADLDAGQTFRIECDRAAPL